MLIGVVVNVQLYQVQEKDTQTKLETLFKKNLYSVAIDLAHSQQYDYNSITDIFRKYGDHLYSCATPFILPFTLLLARSSLLTQGLASLKEGRLRRSHAPVPAND